MKVITIDIRMINNSGIGTYIKNLVPIIIEKNREIRFNCILYRNQEKDYVWLKRVNKIYAKSKIYSPYEQIELVQLIPKDTDLLWCPHFNIPILYRGKLIVTVHDVFHLAMPELLGGIHKKIYAKLIFNLIAKKANSVLTVSTFSKNEIIKYTKICPEKIFVTYNGINNSWFQIKPNNTAINEKPYLLYVGNVKPHKNLNNLLKAFALLINKIPHDLVIVGKKEGFITGDDKLLQTAEELGNRVKFTGFIENKQLENYYINADLLVFPSLYEGFGLPPLEAMACGTPTLVSKFASIPEVCGDASIYCEADNYIDIANKIESIVFNNKLKDTLTLKGYNQAKKFTWEKCAIKTNNIIHMELNSE